MKVAIYGRVSTGKQDYENQLFQLRDFCKNKDWKIYKEYTEIISGKESQRPEFKKMFEEASQKKFDTILVWSLDRFTREGVARSWYYISQLDYFGVNFISYKEPFLNTDNKLVKDLLFSMMSVLAEQERLKISDRTKAGLESAKRKGIKLGKKPISQNIREEIIKLREQGLSYREICEKVHYWDTSRNKHYVSMGFVHKTLSQNSTKKNRNNSIHTLDKK